MLTPYQLATNTPIMASDLDGLEGRLEIITRQEDLGFLKGTITAEEVRENQKARAIGALMGIGVLVDVFVTKGWISKSLFAVSLGDFTHSAQMQSHYREMGMPSRADQYKQEGGAAAAELAIEGLTYGLSKGISKVGRAKPVSWVDDAGNTIWPKNDGFAGTPENVTLEPGARIDRYGYDGGSFVSPEGVPYNARSLAPGSEFKPYNVYDVVKPIDALGGKVAPWFDEVRGGTQYKLNQPIDRLLEGGYIKKVE